MGFEEFVIGQQRGLLRFAAALTGDARLAEDIVANVLGRAYERWARVGGVQHPDAYVRRMIINEFVSHKRSEKRRARLTLGSERLAAVPDPASAHADREELKLRLATLPGKQRAAIVLRYYEGLPDSDIAAILDCACGTVRSLVSRALANLRVEHADHSQTLSGLGGSRSPHTEGNIR